MNLGELKMMITDDFSNTYLCKLLRLVICQNVSPEPARLTPEEFDMLLKLARKHEVQPIAAYGLLLVGGLTEEQEQRCRKLIYSIMAYQRRMDLELHKTCDLLEAAGMAHIPLKGAVIRSFYPEPWLRTSGDIDILLKDADSAAKHLMKCGYQHKMKGLHDITMISPRGIPFELHFQLIDTDARVNCLLEQVWDHARLREGNYRYEMTPELFYFYHIAHMAKHMLHGGCGIRFFTDIWLLRHELSLDEDALNHLLREGGLLTFAKQAESLSRVWFEGRRPTHLELALERYVLNSGVFGSSSNKVKLARSQSDTTAQYVFLRIFLPYNEMVLHYPILKKYPLLLPGFWIRRWAGAVLKRGKFRRVMREVYLNRKIDRDAITATGRLLRALELL